MTLQSGGPLGSGGVRVALCRASSNDPENAAGVAPGVECRPCEDPAWLAPCSSSVSVRKTVGSST